MEEVINIAIFDLARSDSESVSNKNCSSGEVAMNESGQSETSAE